MTAPRGCSGIRPRTWALPVLAGLTSWAALAIAVWLLAGWWTS